MSNEHDQCQRSFESVWPEIQSSETKTGKELAALAFCAGWTQRGNHNVWTEEQRAQYRAAKGL